MSVPDAWLDNITDHLDEWLESARQRTWGDVTFGGAHRENLEDES